MKKNKKNEHQKEKKFWNKVPAYIQLFCVSKKTFLFIEARLLYVFVCVCVCMLCTNSKQRKENEEKKIQQISMAIIAFRFGTIYQNFFFVAAAAFHLPFSPEFVFGTFLFKRKG